MTFPNTDTHIVNSMNYKSETPRTTLRYEADKYDQGAFSAYENMRDLAMELERELTEAIESRKFQLKLNVELNEREKQTHAELTAVTEQRDRLTEAIITHRAKAWPLTGEQFDQDLWDTLATVKGGADE